MTYGFRQCESCAASFRVAMAPHDATQCYECRVRRRPRRRDHERLEASVIAWTPVAPIGNAEVNSSVRWTPGATYCLMTNKDCAGCDNADLLGVTASAGCRIPRVVQYLLDSGVAPSILLIARAAGGEG